MPELRSTQELLRAIGDAAGSTDPIAEIKRRGFTFSAALTQAMARARPRPIAEAARQRAARIASKTKVTIRAGGQRPPAVAARFAPDDYDVIAALNTSLADGILNGMLQTNTIPQRIPFDRFLSESDRATAATALSGVFTNIPQNSALGTLNIRGPFVSRALHNTDALALDVPFSLEIVTLSPIRNVVGVLSGKITFIVALDATEPQLGNLEEAAIVITATLPLSPTQGAPALAIDPASQIQPQRPQNLPTLALLLQRFVAPLIAQSFEISPVINIPNIPGLRLIIQHSDIRTVDAPTGDRIAIGLRFIGAGNAPPNTGRLLNLVPDSGRNIVLRAHERHFDAALAAAQRNGALTEIAKKEDSRARINSADMRFSGNKIIITLEGEVVDACLTVNVNFTVTQTLELILENGQLRVKSTSSPDISNGDQILCAILAFVTALALSLPILIVAPFIGIFQAILIAADLLDFPGPSNSQSIIRLDRPIPGTELIPVLDGLLSRVEDGALITSLNGSLRQDDTNTYIYARFLNTLHGLDPGVPLKRARVDVCDQDAPPPSGDDVNLPRTGETERIIGNKFIRTVSVSYEPPTRDPVLGQGTTNFDGRVMIVLRPGQVANGAGHVVTTTTIENLRTHETETTTTRRAVREGAADVYFRVFAMGDQEDTKGKPGGLTVNLRSKRLGTPAVPLQFALRLDPGIIQ